jgi:hypothetical protein
MLWVFEGDLGLVAMVEVEGMQQLSKDSRFGTN